MPELKKLENLLTQGKITRREFLARVSALGITAALSSSLLIPKARAATPKKGGRFRIGTAGGMTTDSLDPATITNSMPMHVCWQTMNNLVEIDVDSNPIPELAESWEVSADAKQYVFKLRRGVEFHNGKPFEAEDVLFSIRRHMTKDSKSAANVLLKPVKEMKVDDKHTVVFTLESGNADFPYILSDHHLQIIPKDTTEFEKGIGTGGYILEMWEPGVRSLVKRNPNYWKKGKAHFDEVETLAITDVNARTIALKTGQVDFISRCDTKTYHLLEKVPGIQPIKTNGTKHYSLPMRTDRSPYDNNEVRLALKLAFDREHVLRTVLKGYGIVGNDHPISPSNRYYAHELPQRRYDPEKARYYLKKAGLENHVFKIHSSDAAYGGAVDTAILFKEHAAKAGINIDVVREPADGYWSNVWMKKDWSFCFWNGRPTADWTFSLAYASNAAWNDCFWKNERFDKLLVEARTELDENKRRKMYVEMQQILRDEGGAIIPMFAADLQAASDKMQHGKIAANYECDGFKISERWWFA